MIYKDMKCNSCGGNDFNMIATNQYRCNYCGTDLFVQPQQQKNTIPSFPFPQDFSKQTTKQAKMIVFGIIIAAMVPVIIGVATAIFSVSGAKSKIDQQIAVNMGGKIEDGIRMVEEHGKSYPDTLRKTDHNPNVKITIVKSMNELSGSQYAYYFWGIYENKTGAIIKDPRFSIEFFKEGVKINTAYETPRRKYLLPGEKSGFRIRTIMQEPYDQHRILTPTSDFGFYRERPEIKMSKQEMKKTSGGDWEISGIVENISNKKANIEVIAHLYNAKGEYVGTSSGYISGNIGPGEKAKFSFRASMRSSGRMTFADLWDNPAKAEYDYNGTFIE